MYYTLLLAPEARMLVRQPEIIENKTRGLD